MGKPLSLNFGELLHFLQILLKLPKDKKGLPQHIQLRFFGFSSAI